MSPASAWRACALAGLATLAVSFGFALIEHLRPCGPTGGAGAILALELVRTPADLLQLFGGGAQPCAGQLETAQIQALWLDMLAFIPAYAAFLLLGILALEPERGRLALAALAMIAVAALLDEIEGLVLLQLTPAWANPPDLFGPLYWTVRPKFFLLGAGELVIALLLWRGTWLAKLVALPMAVGGAVSIGFLVTAPRNPLMMEGHRWAWTALLVLALIAAIRPSLAKRPQQA